MDLAISGDVTRARPVALGMPRGVGRILRGLGLRLACLAGGAALAALVAVRVQLNILGYQMSNDGMSPDWLAVAAGLLVGGGVLWFAILLAIRLRSLRWAAGLLLGLPLTMLIIGSLAMTYFPPTNFKNDDLRAEWTQLHPTLRHALWVARLGDGHLVLTDLKRTPDDYRLLGLRLPFTSRHYPQTDGYAHAVDLRVSDAGDLRNWARQGMFLLMGLRADRHGGTADHLHVSMPLAPPPAG